MSVLKFKVYEQFLMALSEKPVEIIICNAHNVIDFSESVHQRE